MPAPNHVMIDVECLALTPDARICSIGAVVFDPRANVVTDQVFYTELNWKDQDRVIDPATKLWWTQQSKEARQGLKGSADLADQLEELAFWLPLDCKVWGNGATFDISMLEDAYRQYDIEIPWKFWNIRDCRTIKDLFESKRGGYSKAMGATKHRSVDDAVYQAEYITYMWQKVMKGVEQ